MYGHVITKFSRMGSLPHFVTHGAPLRASRARAPLSKCTDRYARENNAVPIQPVLARIKVTPEKSSSLEIKRLPFPITLAWACTVHKVQGLTLNDVVVNFELGNQEF